MINWIKYTFGSFFSNKLLKEGQTRKFWNTLFALFLTLVILTAFFVTGVNSSFKTQYNNSTTFKEFAYNIFYNENEENRVNIKTYETKNANNKNVIKGKAIRYIDVNDEVLINTFENDADKAIYSKNNYNLIVDTREADDTYFSFTVLYKLKDDENVTINYDEYLKLSASDQEKYTYLKTDIKNEKITLTNEQIEIYKDWLLENYVKGLKDDSQEKTSWNELLKKKDEDIKTSQPAPGDVLDLWEKLLEDHDEIVHIAMSSGLSSSCATAAMLADDYDGKVQVVDNQRISVTQRQSVLDAAKLAEEGKSAKEIKDILEADKLDSGIYIMVDTLKYLKKGGRVTAAGAAIGTVLGIKPVLQIHGEKLDAFAKTRGVKQAKKKMIAAVRKELEERFPDGDFGKHAYLQSAYTKDEEAALKWKEELMAEFPGMEFHQDPLSLSVACHIGAGALAVAWTHKIDD